MSTKHAVLIAESPAAGKSGDQLPGPHHWDTTGDNTHPVVSDFAGSLFVAIGERDAYTGGHSQRVATYAHRFASLLGFNASDVDRIYLAGLLHDVGKLAIPDSVLRSSGRLSNRQMEIIRTHPEAGWRILQGVDDLQAILPGVLHHHERFDGEGYPDGLIGGDIPLDARVLAVCDAFDAMTSNRSYRRGMATRDAADLLGGGAGRQWDPQLVKEFLANIDLIDVLRRKHFASASPVRMELHGATKRVRRGTLVRRDVTHFS